MSDSPRRVLESLWNVRGGWEVLRRPQACRACAKRPAVRHVAAERLVGYGVWSPRGMSISPNTDAMLHGKCVPCAASSLELIAQGDDLMMYVCGFAAVLVAAYGIGRSRWEQLVYAALAGWACLRFWYYGESRREDAERKRELFEAYKRLPDDPQRILSLKLRL